MQQETIRTQRPLSSLSSPTRRAGLPIEALEARCLLAADVSVLRSQGFEATRWNGQEAYAKPRQWVVRMTGLAGTVAQQLAETNRRLDDRGLTAARHLGGDGLFLVRSDRATRVADVRAALDGVKGVAAVEPDFAIWSDATTPNDPFFGFGDQWSLNNTGQTGGTSDADIDAPLAWDLTRGSSNVVVGVIDSGVDYTHPDLAKNVWTNPGEIPDNDRDDDGNGYVDDVHGYDFYDGDGDPMDEAGHGTHVAGTIAAAGNNARGVTGVSWSSKVMAIRFLGPDGTGSTSDAIAAINYATRMRTDHGVNVRVTNNSWAGAGFSTALQDAVRRQGSAGILFVAAAGNGGDDGVGDDTDVDREYPAGVSSDNVLAVAATDDRDRLAGFSNYGAASVDLAAPGVDVLSTIPGGEYGYASGTSMAAPHVAGAAALAWSYRPTATMKAVRAALLDTVDVKSWLKGKVASAGRLNAYKTLRALAGNNTSATPSAPSGLAASATSASQVKLTWNDTSSNETGFKIERKTGSSGSWAQIATVGANVESYTNTGRAAGTTYAYRVRAYNAAGNSGFGPTATVTTPLLGTFTGSRDVGGVAAAGAASFSSSGGTYTIKGSGADVYNKSDEFRFVYRALRGDGSITARVDSLQGSHGFAKAGVMIRETLASNSRNAFLAVTPDNGVRFQRRTSTGGSTARTEKPGVSAPEWLRLTRAGNTITARYSPDGKAWKTIGTATVTMAADVYVGLAVTSHQDGKLATAKFSNVAVTGGSGAGAAGATRAAVGTGRGLFSSTPVGDGADDTADELLA